MDRSALAGFCGFYEKNSLNQAQGKFSAPTGNNSPVAENFLRISGLRSSAHCCQWLSLNSYFHKSRKACAINYFFAHAFKKIKLTFNLLGNISRFYKTSRTANFILTFVENECALHANIEFFQIGRVVVVINNKNLQIFIGRVCVDCI